MPPLNDNSIILFDGVCKFCHWYSECTKRLTKDISNPNLTSMVLLENGKVYYKSSAALRIAKSLTFPWPLLFIFIIIPPVIRHMVYDFIGNHRYQWFGKYDHCVVPDDHIREKFLD